MKVIAVVEEYFPFTVQEGILNIRVLSRVVGMGGDEMRMDREDGSGKGGCKRKRKQQQF